jgi:hypothetical protein
LGTFRGTFSVVVQGDNAVDSPEFVIAKGKFLGQMNFSPAILYTIPLGSVTGTLWLQSNPLVDDGDEWPGPGVPFTGIFRLPFVVPVVPENELPACLAGSDPTACFSAPLYLLNAPDPLPVDMNTWELQPVKDAEKALAFPTVRFEISIPNN